MKHRDTLQKALIFLARFAYSEPGKLMCLHSFIAKPGKRH